MPDPKNKIVMLGDSGVGKTSLVNKWIKGTYSAATPPTIGAAYMQTVFSYDGKDYKIQIWDTAGEEKYRAMAPVYAQGSFGAVIVVDITRENAFETLDSWIEMARKDDDIPIIVAGNKYDLESEKKIDFEMANKACEARNLQYLETSAQSGYGVEDLFGELLRQAFEKRAANIQVSTSIIDVEKPINSVNNKSDGCC